MLSCSSCRAGSLGKAGVVQVCLPTANTVSTANQSFCSSGLSCKKPAAACCLGHFSCGMMIRGGDVGLEREWVGVAAGRLRVLVALSTICCHGLSFGCRLVWRCGRMNLAVTSETDHRSTMRPVTLMTFLFAAQAASWLPAINARNRLFVPPVTL